MKSLIHEKETYAVLGACLEVYKEKGCGFLESVFQECLALELSLQQIPTLSQVPMTLTYKGKSLRQQYIADFVCFDRILVEIKAVSRLADEHRARSKIIFTRQGCGLVCS